MKTGMVVCFVLAGMTCLGAVSYVWGRASEDVPFDTLVGNAVGAFLLPIVLLIVGLVLRDKAQRRR